METKSPKAESAAAQLDTFIARLACNGSANAHGAAKAADRLPGAVEMVYDNYYALVIGFCPVERASEAILSIAVYPRWINLNFLVGDRLPDPGKAVAGQWQTQPASPPRRTRNVG